jgi:glycosyltransferase involved in cell wall biosynthesis
VFFAGRHHWEKGFDTFLKVASLIDKERYKIRFVCTGKGFGPVEGKGFLNDEELAEAYSEAHLVLYPSRMDTVGGVIIEASACGTPVATTSISAHSLNLPLFYGTNVKEFADIVIKAYNLFFNEREEYYRLTHELHEKATYYSTEKIFPKFESMLKSVSVINASKPSLSQVDVRN